MIDAQHLTNCYGEKTHRRPVLHHRAGKLSPGFLGPNGAGRSTTMRMLVDLDRPTSVNITVDGARWRGREDEAGRLLRLGKR